MTSHALYFSDTFNDFLTTSSGIENVTSDRLLLTDNLNITLIWCDNITTTILSNVSKITSAVVDPPSKKDYIFDRTDVRVIFITIYSLVFFCCFVGK